MSEYPIRSRQQKILEYINKSGLASVKDLASIYSVSQMTIRRDIDHLAQAKLLCKIKGGAQCLEESVKFHEAHLRARLETNVAAKQRLADKAASLIDPGDTVFLDGSTTMICLAQVLARYNRRITVVTNSVLIALELVNAENVRLLSLGGVFDRETFTFTLPAGGNAGFDYHFAKAFMSCSGFVPGEGTYENSVANLSLKRQVARNADTVHLVVDTEKFGKRALNRVLGMEDIDMLITEPAYDAQYKTLISKCGISECLTDDKR